VVQGLKFPSQNPNPRGEEGGRERTGRGLWEEQSSSVLASGKKNWQPKRKGVRGIFFLTPTTLTQKDYITPRLK
jgi:hypothetical protein